MFQYKASSHDITTLSVCLSVCPKLKENWEDRKSDSCVIVPFPTLTRASKDHNSAAQLDTALENMLFRNVLPDYYVMACTLAILVYSGSIAIFYAHSRFWRSDFWPACRLTDARKRVIVPKPNSHD